MKAQSTFTLTNLKAIRGAKIKQTKTVEYLYILIGIVYIYKLKKTFLHFINLTDQELRYKRKKENIPSFFYWNCEIVIQRLIADSLSNQGYREEQWF